MTSLPCYPQTPFIICTSDTHLKGRSILCMACDDEHLPGVGTNGLTGEAWDTQFCHQDGLSRTVSSSTLTTFRGRERRTSP